MDHGISARSSLENTHPAFALESLKKAQADTWKVLNEIQLLITPGITEEEARKTALRVFSDHGVKKHWHRPYVRLGQGTCLSFNDPIEPNYQLQGNDVFYIDLGPVWERDGLSYEGDVGKTFVVGNLPEAKTCADFSEKLFQDGLRYWRETNASGPKLYDYLRTTAQASGYHFHQDVEGHRISDFPHHKYSKESLSVIETPPVAGLWILEVQILDPKRRFGAFYEDILI